MLRNSLIREMSFKANFILWMIVEVLWFCGQIFFLRHHLRAGRSDRRLVEMGSRPARRHTSNRSPSFSRLSFSSTSPTSRNWSGPGKLDSLLVLPIDSQFAVSTKQFGLDSIVNALLGGVVVIVSLVQLQIVPSAGLILLYLVALGFGVAIHYSIMLSLAAVSFWIVRAQGLIYGYFNFLQIARYPDVIFPRLFRFIFGWIIPVIIVANIPARLLIKPLGQPGWLMLHLVVAGSIAFCLSRVFWRFALRRYSSASS